MKNKKLTTFFLTLTIVLTALVSQVQGQTGTNTPVSYIWWTIGQTARTCNVTLEVEWNNSAACNMAGTPGTFVLTTTTFWTGNPPGIVINSPVTTGGPYSISRYRFTNPAGHFSPWFEVYNIPSPTGTTYPHPPCDDSFFHNVVFSGAFLLTGGVPAGSYPGCNAWYNTFYSFLPATGGMHINFW